MLHFTYIMTTDISLLTVPSAESLTTYVDEHFEVLADGVNESWNNSDFTRLVRERH